MMVTEQLYLSICPFSNAKASLELCNDDFVRRVVTATLSKFQAKEPIAGEMSARETWNLAVLPRS